MAKADEHGEKGTRRSQNGAVDRRPRFSPSRLTTYLACPHKYHWTYLSPRGRWFIRSKSTFSFGLALHGALEQFHSGGSAGVPTKDEMIAAYEESWIDAGFANAEEMAEAFGEGKEILSRYVDEHEAARAGAKTIEVERTYRIDYDDFTLTGRIDRLDEHEDGSLEIVDYKTGRQSVTEEDVRGDISMGIYQLLVSRSYPGRKVSATIMALRSGQSATASLTQQELDDLEFDVLTLGRMILNHEWAEMPPVKKDLCKDCDFLKLCERDPRYNGAY